MREKIFLIFFVRGQRKFLFLCHPASVYELFSKSSPLSPFVPASKIDREHVGIANHENSKFRLPVSRYWPSDFGAKFGGFWGQRPYL